MQPQIDVSPQAELSLEIDSLRERFPETQALYREVCSLLFFRYGITPTANKLYQMVRRGSMSAPAEALARFWGDLREKSRVRIEHPDLPPELAALAGELVGSLWQRARASAEDAFSAAMVATRATVAEAHAQAATELARAESAAHALFQLQAEFSSTLTRLQDLENALAREQGLRDATERQMASAITQRRELQESLAAARREFEAQSAAEQQVLREAEDRLQGERQRLVADAEREREMSASMLREFEQLRRSADAQSTQHAATVESLQREIAHLRQDLGLAEGAVTELRAARDFLQRRVDTADLRGGAATGRRRGRIVRSVSNPG
jgi:DNA repair exonuclease SbcCD ATPase subunit